MITASWRGPREARNRLRLTQANVGGRDEGHSFGSWGRYPCGQGVFCTRATGTENSLGGSPGRGLPTHAQSREKWTIESEASHRAQKRIFLLELEGFAYLQYDKRSQSPPTGGGCAYTLKSAFTCLFVLK